MRLELISLLSQFFQNWHVLLLEKFDIHLHSHFRTYFERERKNNEDRSKKRKTLSYKVTKAACKKAKFHKIIDQNCTYKKKETKNKTKSNNNINMPECYILVEDFNILEEEQFQDVSQLEEIFDLTESNDLVPSNTLETWDEMDMNSQDNDSQVSLPSGSQRGHLEDDLFNEIMEDLPEQLDRICNLLR